MAFFFAKNTNNIIACWTKIRDLEFCCDYICDLDYTSFML